MSQTRTNSQVITNILKTKDSIESLFCSKDLECPVFTAAWNEASEESRRKTMRSTATAKSATNNNCPVYACVTPLRMLLKWEKVCQFFVDVQTILLALTPLGI